MSYRNEDFWIEVNLENLCANYDAVRKTVGGKKGVMAVVKADAYGHGYGGNGQGFGIPWC